MSSTKIKFCGFTDIEDVKYALDLGIDFLGLVFVESSPRYIDLLQAEGICKICEGKIKTVGVFMNNSDEFVSNIIDNVNLDYLQFHGQESLDICVSYNKPYIKTVHISDINVINKLDHDENHPLQPNFLAYLLDTKIKGDSGGTGVQFNWNDIAKLKETLNSQNNHILIAGGLNPQNIQKLILKHNPWGIDVSSGIESTKRKKSFTLMKKFIENVKIADHEKNE